MQYLVDLEKKRWPLFQVSKGVISTQGVRLTPNPVAHLFLSACSLKCKTAHVKVANLQRLTSVSAVIADNTRICLHPPAPRTVQRIPRRKKDVQ